MAGQTSYTDEIGDTICQQLCEGKSLRAICREMGKPSAPLVMEWVLKGERGDERFVKFAEQYTRAREIQAEFLVDEIIEIADDSSGDYKIDEKGKRVLDSEFLGRSKLRVDTRKWYAGKVRAKKYGEKVTNEHTGADGATLAVLNIFQSKDGHNTPPEAV